VGRILSTPRSLSLSELDEWVELPAPDLSRVADQFPPFVELRLDERKTREGLPYRIDVETLDVRHLRALWRDYHYRSERSPLPRVEDIPKFAEERLYLAAVLFAYRSLPDEWDREISGKQGQPKRVEPYRLAYDDDLPAAARRVYRQALDCELGFDKDDRHRYYEPAHYNSKRRRIPDWEDGRVRVQFYERPRRPADERFVFADSDPPPLSLDLDFELDDAGDDAREVVTWTLREAAGEHSNRPGVAAETHCFA
jgi:hypothetical protein